MAFVQENSMHPTNQFFRESRPLYSQDCLAVKEDTLSSLRRSCELKTQGAERRGGIILMASEIDSAALQSPAGKRPLESSSALPEVNPKRPCAAPDADGDSFEEFFALLQRIEATERHCLRRRGANWREPAAKCVEAGKAGDAKAVMSQASWWPSFEWEDFSAHGNGTRDVDSNARAGNLKGTERERDRGSPEARLERERSLDLNLPAA